MITFAPEDIEGRLPGCLTLKNLVSYEVKINLFFLCVLPKIPQNVKGTAHLSSVGHINDLLRQIFCCAETVE